jgi:hypothetical protein
VTGILDTIDDTLDDWRGSRDCMRWTPEPDITVTLTADTSHWVAAMARLQGAVEVIVDSACTMKPVFEAVGRAFDAVAPYLAEPRPSALNAKYHLRQRNRRRSRP